MYLITVGGIRGFATLLVIYYHFYKSILLNGYLGVDIFFLLSGYILYYSQRIRNNDNIFSFLSRRAKRIFPLKAIVIYLISFLNMTKRIEEYSAIYKEELYTFFFLSNYYYISISKDYFLSQDTNLLLHFWSLSVEEQYYLFFSFFYKYTNYLYKSNRFYLYFVNGSALCVSLFYFISFYRTRIYQSYYSFICRLWEFITGIFLISLNKYSSIINSDYIVFFMLIICFINSSFYYLHILFIILSGLIIVSDNRLDSIISSHVLQYIGAISFSVYLIHYPINLIYNKYRWTITITFSIIMYYSIESNKYIKRTNNSIFIIMYIILIIGNYYLYRNIIKTEIIYETVSYKETFISDMCSYHFVVNVNPHKIIILLLGDSHVLHYIRALYDLKKKIILYHYFLHSGSILNNVYNIDSFILQIHFNIVLISFSHFYFIKKYYIFEKNINFLIKYILNISSHIILIADNPRLYFNPNIALNRNLFYGVENRNCSITRNINFSFCGSNNSLHIYNFSRLLTKGNICILKINNIPIYIDSNHLNSVFVQRYIRYDLIDYIEKEIIKKKIWESNILFKAVSYYSFIQSGNIYQSTCKNNYKKLKHTIR